MNPVELILELRGLLADAQANGAKIRELIESHQDMAEYQIARFYAARHLVPQVEALISEIDPKQRLAGVELIRFGFPRTLAGKLLRRVVKDPDIEVRKRARSTVKHLGLEEIALPDTRYDGARSIRGKFNTTGWAFGLFAEHARRAWNRVPKKATQIAALGAQGLPVLASIADVQALLGVDAAGLARLMRPGTESGSAYVEFEIPKAKGGTRRIAAPRGPLRRAQRALLDQILAKVPQHPAAHGFVAGRSTVTNARPHVGAALVVKTDLKDFFPTVHYRRVIGLFELLGYNEAVAGVLAALTTYRPKLPDGRVVWPGVLPQGAPTSPALANLACRRLDARLTKLAAKYGAVYTRYADDLTFSFSESPKIAIGRFLWWVDGICQQEGFVEHPGKRKLLRAKTQQRITGLVINRAVHVPRADRRRFRALLHNCAKHGVASQAKGRENFAAYLAGYAAYVQMVQPELGKAWAAQVAKLLGEAP
ncbi:MAG: RNA-directed DNA polymerase [Myxococcales bacterium]|nr:RNA-directed DNA polymerase [Myxococcales bacterium]